MDVEEDTSRRKFIRVATIGASAACGIFPIAAGIPSVLDPVKKSAESGGNVAWSKVAPIASLPEDGSPAKFEVIQAREAMPLLQDQGKGVLEDLENHPP